MLVALADPANHRFGPLTVWGRDLCPTTAETWS